MNNLADALAAEIKRMNEEIIPCYVEIIPIAPMTALTVAMMRREVQQAVEAAINGDVVAMMNFYQSLKEYGV